MDLSKTMHATPPMSRGIQKHPSDAKCVTEILGRTKIRKLGEDKV